MLVIMIFITCFVGGIVYDSYCKMAKRRGRRWLKFRIEGTHRYMFFSCHLTDCLASASEVCQSCYSYWYRTLSSDTCKCGSSSRVDDTWFRDVVNLSANYTLCLPRTACTACRIDIMTQFFKSPWEGARHLSQFLPSTFLVDDLIPFIESYYGSMPKSKLRHVCSICHAYVPFLS